MTVTATARPTAASPKALLISTSPQVLALCAASFGISTMVVLWLMRLRQGVYELESLSIFYSLFVFYDYWPALLGLVVVALALLRPVQVVALDLSACIGRRPGTTALVTLFILAIGSLLSYRAHPLAMDEYAPYFQSQVFAAGHLTGRFPVPLMDWLVAPDFQGMFLLVSHQTGAVASAYMPGFALLLTPFTVLGVPWLCNPVLGAASVLALHRLAVKIFDDERSAGLAVLLALGSTAFTINSISFYSMTAHALANMVFALLLLEPTPRRCVAAGVVGSVALVLHNPLPHTLFALPWLVWLAWRRDRLRTLPPLILGYLPLFAILGIGWSQFGSNLQGPVAGGAGASSDVVTRWSAGLNSFLAVPTLDVLWIRGIGLAKLWVWAVPGLLVAVLAGMWKGRKDVGLRLLTASFATTLIGFLFVVFSQGHGWGFRYVHSAWLALPVLAVAGVRTGKPLGEPHTPGSYLAAAALLALVLLNAQQAWQVRSFMDRHLAQTPGTTIGSPRVVIVNPAMGYYAADLVQNDPFLRDPVVRLLSQGRRADADMMHREFPSLSRLDSSVRGEVWGLAGDGR